MPGRDGTGPLGEGPATGRGLGQCMNSNVGKYAAGLGLGLGLGLACRRGFRRWFGRGNNRGLRFNQAFSNSPKELLEAQKNLLQNRLEAIDKQLKKY